MAVVLAATGLFLYLRLRSDLDEALNAGLRSRAADVSALAQQADTGLRDSVQHQGPGAVAFAQVVTAGGRVVDSTVALAGRPLLRREDLGRARRAPTFINTSQSAVAFGPVRLFAVPVRAQSRDLVIVVGASLAERSQALADLRALLLVGGPAALLLASLAAWGLATAALRPVESMRRRAAQISSDQPGQRLPLSPSRDELHRLGETLNEMLARLEAGLERERSFTADASHELRTPLTLIKTELELIANDRPAGARLQEAVASAIAEADRLAKLVDDLLVLARCDRAEAPLRVESILATDLLSAVRQRYGRTAEEGVRIDIDAPPGLRVRGDGVLLEHALGNMLDNALRHGGGRARLTARAEPGLVVLGVGDDGEGFPRGFVAHAFDRFARADSARGREGTGLGLAIVHAVAERHGGRAEVRNRPGGADVWIELPTTRGHSVQRPSRASSSLRDGRGSASKNHG